MLWQELNDVRFTTPLLREWLPYIEGQLRDHELLENAQVFNVSCGILNLNTDALDRIVSEGIKSGAIGIEKPRPTTALGLEPPIPEPDPEPDPEPVPGPAPEPEPAKTARSYRVAVKILRQDHPSYNGCRYETHEAAEAAAKNLYSRWTMMEGWEIEESEDEPNTDLAKKPPEPEAPRPFEYGEAVIWTDADTGIEVRGEFRYGHPSEGTASVRYVPQSSPVRAMGVMKVLEVPLASLRRP